MNTSNTFSNLSCRACAIARFCAAIACMCSLRNVLGLFSGSGSVISAATCSCTKDSCSSWSSIILESGASCTTAFFAFTFGFATSSSSSSSSSFGAMGILLILGFASTLPFGLPLPFALAAEVCRSDSASSFFSGSSSFSFFISFVSVFFFDISGIF